VWAVSKFKRNRGPWPGWLPVTGYRFRPRLVPSLAVAALLPPLVALGVWQTHRAEEKEAMLAQAAVYRNALPVTLDPATADAAALRYHLVQAEGHYLADRQLLLDNQVESSRVGYHVLTPFLLRRSGKVVLVDRGWVPLGESRQRLPEVPVTGHERRLVGTVDRPPQVGLHLGSGSGTGDWPRVIQYVVPTELAQALNRPVLPLVVRLGPDQPDGYVRDWHVVTLGPERHRGYAFQWFGLAVTLTVLYLAVSLRREGDAGEAPRPDGLRS
jgi:surfeit locus 1 family protein